MKITCYMPQPSLIVDFNSREDLDNWLKVEPYMVGKVWEKVEVRGCKVSPLFLP
jgi:uncharacterized protein YciI